MGLEDLVNLILKPLEGVGQVVYDLCFATSRTKEACEGKVTYKYTYMTDNPFRKYFDNVKNGYKAVKEFTLKQTARRLDTGISYLENYANEYLIKPIDDFVNKNFTNRALACSLLAVGLYCLI